MPLADLAPAAAKFTPADETLGALESACRGDPDIARFAVIGTSEEGRPLAGITLGHGPLRVTLVAGAHADEPVGPETLRTLVLQALAHREALADLFERFTFRVVPHVNPDGAERNRAWVERWPDLGAYLAHRDRELPGRDVEFGYPVMRPENAAASRFLFPYAPVALHMSLHGMAFAEGALLLVERRWSDRVDALKSGWEAAVRAAGLRLHDHDRAGDKGFRYYGPGFLSTPEGTAMRAHFEAAGDAETAGGFFLSSMELAVLAGRDPATGETPLCLVTELPLFVLDAPYAREPGVPAMYHRFAAELPALTLAARRGDDLTGRVAPYGLRALDLATAIRLQLSALDLGLGAVVQPGSVG